MKPKIGMGVTYSVGSDRYPATIVHISPSGKTIQIQDDNFKRVDNNGISEDQSYVCSLYPNGKIQKATLRQNGRFLLSGWRTGGFVGFGHRSPYLDPHF